MSEARFFLIFVLSLLAVSIIIAGAGDGVAMLATVEKKCHCAFPAVDDLTCMYIHADKWLCDDVLVVSRNDLIQNMCAGLIATSRACKGMLAAGAYAIVPILTFLIPTILACLYGRGPATVDCD